MPAVAKRKKEVPVSSVPEVCKSLQELQKERARVIKSRNMQMNRLRSIVAGELGYNNSMTDRQRQAKFKEADEYVKRVQAEPEKDGTAYHRMIRASLMGVNAFDALKADLEARMEERARELPVASWVDEREQRGFGIQFLATVVGEAGDLSNYANPAKLWRRLGCAPYRQADTGLTWMGATWRGGRQGKLSKEEWTEYGYSPRRRSISYLIGYNIRMQNLVRDRETKEVVWTGPYRLRYEEAKARVQDIHPDYSKMRCDLHGMLLATKLLLKNLWRKWHGQD